MTAYTTSLRLAEPVPGDPAVKNAWGTILNTNDVLIEAALTGTASVPIGGLTTYNLTTANGAADQARPLLQNYTGALSANCTVTLPNVAKIGWAQNSTTGGFSVILTAGAGTAATIPPDGRWYWFQCDGAGDVTLPSVGFGGLALPGALSAGGLSISGAGTITGLLTASGGITAGAQMPSAAATLTTAIFGQLIEVVGGTAFTLTLPTPVGNAGAFRLWLNTSQAITFSTPAGKFYGPSGNGSASITLTAGPIVFYDFESDGVNWVVAGSVTLSGVAAIVGGAFPVTTAPLTVSTILTASTAGTYFNVFGAATIQTLPAASAVPGMTYGFGAVSACTIASAGGSFAFGGFSGSSVSLAAEDVLVVQSDGVTWRLVYATPDVLGYATTASLAAYTLPARQLKFTTTGTTVVPAGVTVWWVDGCAGGAGGNSNYSGGAGQPAIAIPIAVVPGHTITINIGSGGVGGTGSGGGTAGGNTTIVDTTSGMTLLSLTGAGAPNNTISTGYPNGSGSVSSNAASMVGASGPFGGGGNAGGTGGGVGGNAYGFGAGGGSGYTAGGGAGAPGLILVEF